MTERKRWIAPLVVIVLGACLLACSFGMCFEWAWVKDVDEHMRSARKATDAWEVKYELEGAHEILVEHGWKRELSDYICWANEVGSIEDGQEYRRGLFYLKRGLDDVDLHLPSLIAMAIGVCFGVVAFVMGCIWLQSRRHDC